MTGKNVQTLSIVNFLICGGGILIFVAIALYPNQRSLSGMDTEIRQMTAHLEEQEALFPLFEELMKINQEKEPENLPFPEKMILDRNSIGIISSQFEDIAQTNRLDLEEITPDVNTLIDDSGRLRMFIKMRGRFFDLRQFLTGIGAIPYLEHIEQIQIRTLQESEDLDMSLKVWLARE